MKEIYKRLGEEKNLKRFTLANNWTQRCTQTFEFKFLFVFGFSLTEIN